MFCSLECVKGLRDDIALRFRKLPIGEGVGRGTGFIDLGSLWIYDRKFGV